MVGKKYRYEEGAEELIERFEINAPKDLITIKTDVKTRYASLKSFQPELIKYSLYVPEPDEIQTNENWRSKPEEEITEIIMENTEIAIAESQTPAGSLSNLREVLLKNIDKIAKGELPLDKAKEIVAHSHAIINITKLELEFMKLKKTTSKA